MEHCVLSGHLLGHKTSLNKFKWMGIISFFSDHNDRELEINCRKKNEGGKGSIYMKSKQHAAKRQKKRGGSTMKSKRKFINTLRQMTIKTQPYYILILRYQVINHLFPLFKFVFLLFSFEYRLLIHSHRIILFIYLFLKKLFIFN